MSGSRSSLLASLTLLTVLAITGPAAAENVLRFTGKDAWATTMDPHSYSSEDNKGATYQIYEALLDVDSNLAVVPQLAVSWQIIDPTHWEFKLREGVRFHDGTPFTADDVVFSIQRARAKTSDFKDRVDGIVGMEAPDDHTIRFTTGLPDPSLWLKLADVAIMSKAWAQAHGVTKPADFMGAHEETYASRHANGTGPFVLESLEPRGGWALVRNPDWWDTAGYPHNIDRIIHIAKRDPENVAALLVGKVDLIQGVPYWALPQIRSHPELKVTYRPKLMTMFYGLDLGSAELRSSNIKGRNPFKDRRVRQAMAYAMDLQSALHDLMGELFIPAGMIAAPGVNGYIPELDRPPIRDPERAKALLAEAGYPDGFSVTLDCPNNWGDDEITECTAAAQQLSAVGLEIAVKFMPQEEWEEKVYKRHESDFHIAGSHMDPDSERILRERFHSQGEWNVSGYANPRVDELLDKIKGEMVTYARDAYLEEAWRIVTGDLVYLPIRHGISVLAMRKDLEIPPDPWDVPRFRLARFTGPNP
jgi:peptide/nickel transport system substrate-binding protein